jgi:hypothetical protein
VQLHRVESGRRQHRGVGRELGYDLVDLTTGDRLDLSAGDGAPRPSRETATYETVVMAAPPAAIWRWKSIRLCDTTLPGIMPSNVAAFSIRLRRLAGPSLAGPNGSVMHHSRA